MDELTEFHRELIADVKGDADANGLITGEAFLEKVADVLDEAGEASSLSQGYYEGKFDKKNTRGLLPVHTSQKSGSEDFLEDALGRPMGPAHANRGSRRYRYYVSRENAAQSEAPWRIPARELEAIVQRGLSDFLADGLRISAELGDALKANEGLKVEGARLAARAADATLIGPLLEELDARIIVRQDMISISINGARLVDLLSYSHAEVDAASITIEVAVQLRRRGHELKLIYAAPEARPAMRDDRLIQLLAQGRDAYRQLCAGPVPRPSRQHLVRLSRLAFLAPDITTAILEGRQPVELNTRSLLRVAELPIEWSEQRNVLGFV